MDIKKIKKMKRKMGNSIETTSRNYDKLRVGIERYVDIAEVITVWKNAFYIVLILSVFLIGSSIYLLNKKTVYPYVVRVNSTTGEVVKTEVLKNESLNVNKNEIEYFLKKFIVDVRTITLDKKVFDKTLKDANNFLTNSTQEKMKSILTNEGVLNFFENGKTREVEILSFIAIPESKDTYQIRWREKEYDNKGQLIKRKNMNTVVKLNFFVPKVEQIASNPLGIIIMDFNLTQEN